MKEQTAYLVRTSVATAKASLTVTGLTLDVIQRYCDALAELVPGPFTEEWDDAVTTVLSPLRMALLGADKSFKKLGLS